MTGIVLIMVLAIMVEALIEYAKTIGRFVVQGEWKTAITQAVAILLAVLLCFMTGGDLFTLIGIDFIWPWLGTLLTGIIISRGANYVSDFVKRLQGVKGD